MAGRLVGLIFVVFFIVSIGIGFYIVDKKFDIIGNSQVEDTPMRDVYVDAIDARSNIPLRINFTLVSNKTILMKGSTNKESLEKISVPDNTKLMEFYVDDDKYYRDLAGLIGSKITIEPRPIGNLSINHFGKLNNTNGNITTFIETDYENREISFCVAWSQSIIDVKTEYPEILLIKDEFDCVVAGYQWIVNEDICKGLCKLGIKEPIITPPYCSSNTTTSLPPSFLNDRIDKCFYSRKTITIDDPLVFDLNYKSYDSINDKDFIDLYIIDSNSDYDNLYKFESPEGEDWGAKTLKHRIS